MSLDSAHKRHNCWKSRQNGVHAMHSLVAAYGPCSQTLLLSSAQ
jgi:hypothetical protein